jgi:hypothetical protein
MRSLGFKGEVALPQLLRCIPSLTSVRGAPALVPLSDSRRHTLAAPGCPWRRRSCALGAFVSCASSAGLRCGHDA